MFERDQNTLGFFISKQEDVVSLRENQDISGLF